MPIKVLQFFPHNLSARKGGPYTYLYNLKSQLPSKSDVQILFLSDLMKFEESETVIESGPSKAKGFFKQFIPDKWIYNRRVSQYLKEIKSEHVKTFSSFNFDEYAIIHFHEAIDLWRFAPLLSNYKGKIIFTSHCPVPYHLELLHEVFKLQKKDISDDVYKELESIDKTAFNLAQQFVFPCKEALDAYYKWNGFEQLIKNKPVHYLPTGIPPARTTVLKKKVFSNLNIPADAFVVSYTGRHSEVKGYDLLEEAAAKLFAVNSEIYFIVAGEKKGIEKFSHKQWIETGWTDDPYSLINAADVHVIPNRETYFDLNTLEAFSLGKPVILTEVGGNNYFKQLKGNKGIVFVQPDANDIKAKIEDFFKQRYSLLSPGRDNKAAFEKYFTAQQFCNNYIDLYSKLS